MTRTHLVESFGRWRADRRTGTRTVARADTPLAPPARAARLAGRIAGVAGDVPPERVAAWRRRLPSTVQWLDAESPLVADHACCSLDDEPVSSAKRWERLVREGRLGDVRGAFAVAWVQPDGSVGLARDAVGERRLHLLPHGAGFVFASSLRILLQWPGLQRELHLPAVAAYLSCGFVPGSQTLLTGVHELRPGERVELRRGKILEGRLWSLPSEPRDRPLEEPDEAAAELRHHLELAVRRRLPTDGAVGASLSGGLDSSLVVALARRFHSGPLRTWSVCFGRGHANELPFSNAVARHCETRHTIVEIRPDAILSHLDDTVAWLDQPNGDPLTVPNALMFREAGRYVHDVFNGEGGDPCFGGPKNLPMLAASLFGDGRETNGRGPGMRERSYLRSFQKCFDDLDRLLSPRMLAAVEQEPVEDWFAPLFAEQGQRSLIAKLMMINLRAKGAQNILPKVDALSEPFGLEPASPLFDRDVVQHAFAIPTHWKLRGSTEKWLLKRAVRDLLPREIIERPKSGMLVPVESWFRGPLLQSARERILDGLTPWELFDRRALERLLAQRQRALHPRRGVKLWLLITLEAWLRRVFQETGGVD